MDHIDNTFLTYAVTMYGWLNSPGYGSLFLMSFLASTLIPIGSEWLLVLMLAKGAFSPTAVVLTATAGNFIGAVTTWLIGIHGGTWLIERVLRVSPREQERARAFYSRYGKFSLLFSWVPIVGDPLCLVGGLLGIDFWIFSLLVAVGKLVRYLLVAWATLGFAA